MMHRPWGHGAVLRQCYEYRDEHKNRMGSCDWLPSNGDICIATEHSGDHFYTYVAMRKHTDGKWVRVGKFGAYVFGTAIGKSLDERTFHLACAGEPVELPLG